MDENARTRAPEDAGAQAAWIEFFTRNTAAGSYEDDGGFARFHDLDEGGSDA